MAVTGSSEHYEAYKAAHPEWYWQPQPGTSTIAIFFLRLFYNPLYYLRRVRDNYGWAFLLLLISGYFCIKGYLLGLVQTSQLPMLVKKMGVDAQSYQIYGSVAFMPMTLKPFMGLVSDLFPIAGYFKKWWIFGSALAGGVVLVIIGTVDFTADQGAIVAMLLFLVMWEVALVDLLLEGRYAAMMVANPETSSDVLTWVWANYYLGQLVSTWVVGLMGDKFGETQNGWWIKGIFLVSIPFAIQICGPLLADWLDETPLPPGQRGFQREKWVKHNNVFQLALLMGVGAAGMTLLSLVNNKYWRPALAAKSPFLAQIVVFVYAVIVSVIIVVFSFKKLPTQVAKAMLYMFLASATYIDVKAATDIFYTGTPNCVPNGPGFDLKYFITVSGSIAALAGAVGVVLFQAIMSEWEFRPVFWVSTTLMSIAAMCDIILVKRWNIDIGLSDKAMYIMGYNIIYNVCYMLHFMPIMVLISKLCPKGMESTLYALLAGFLNFGFVVSKTIGVFLIAAFNVNMKSAGPCNLDNLPMLIGVSHMIVPILVQIPCTFLLIHKGRLTDPVAKEDLDAMAAGFHPAHVEENGSVDNGAVMTEGKVPGSSPMDGKKNFSNDA